MSGAIALWNVKEGMFLEYSDNSRERVLQPFNMSACKNWFSAVSHVQDQRMGGGGAELVREDVADNPKSQNAGDERQDPASPRSESKP